MDIRKGRDVAEGLDVGEGLDIDMRPAGDPDVRRLIAAAIAELNVRYPGDVELEPVPEVSEHFVAVADGVAVGLVVLVRVKAGQGEVKRLYVHPGHRGRGAARALMSALEERARGRGMSAVRLETGTRQPEAMALYESLGYTIIENYGQYADSPLTRSYAKRLRADATTSPSSESATH
jgi:ribosomal protein S18 acetylase RimI-like enzyme